LFEEINQYVQDKEAGPDATFGQKPDDIRWLPTGITVTVAAGPVGFCDAWAVPDDPVTVDLVPGPYEIELQLVAYGADVRVAASRIRRVGVGAVTLKKGKTAGRFGVDVATAAMFEVPVFEALENKDEDGYLEWLEGQYTKMDGLAGVIAHPDGAAYFYSHTGFGDGSYDVHELKSGDEVVGAEARFLAPDERYPFNREVTPAEDGFNRLIQACLDGDLESVRSLLAQGVHPDGQNFYEDQTGALLFAVSKNRVEVCRLLLDAGADVNWPSKTYGMPYLMIAVVNRSMDAMKYLLERGADPTLKSENGDTPAKFAKSFAPDMYPILAEAEKEWEAKKR
jgi:hypothetical protein